jgi:TolB protein
MPCSGRSSNSVALVLVGLAALGLLPFALAQAPPASVPPAAPPASQGPSQIIIDPAAAGDRLAVPDCVPRAGDEAAREACKTITTVLRDDLRFEDISIVSENLYKALPPLKPDAPNFEDWKSIGAQVLVITKAEVTAGELHLELRVHHVDSGQSMLSKRYSNRADNPRAFAHQAADEIFALQQLKGVARSKIAFVSDRDASKGKATKEIYIMDYDGHAPRRVTVNRSINILPSWNPDGKAFAYISYRNVIPELFIAWIHEGRSAGFPAGKGGQVLSHAFSPDGKKIAFASTRGGNTDIWVANSDGSDARRLTDTAASEAAPCWSPTGREIAFTRSLRIGAPQVWVMDSEGLNPRRVTHVSNYNDAPSWNPAKEYATEIAYTSRLEGGFEVAVLDLANGQVRQVTSGVGKCESPTWAPNGRHLALSCERGGRWQVTVVDRLGRNPRTLAAGPGNNAQPDWGPAPAQ